MKKTLMLILLILSVCVSNAWSFGFHDWHWTPPCPPATPYDYGDAPGYPVATHTTPDWQRLGTVWDSETTQKAVDTSDDGVLWSINGGAYGNSAIMVGDTVTFQFTMYKEYWGTHNYDYLRFWIDWNQDGDFTDAGETMNTYTYNNSKLGSYAIADQYIYFYYTMSFDDVDSGDYWLRARVTCDESIGYNLNNFTSTGNFWQGEVEDWMLIVAEGQQHEVPEPASLVLLGAGLLGLAAIRRKLKK